ncbi:MAG: class I SAM-dependent methyltransferase [Solirubrobacterales bacterium]|nr:class I SAM-dependent methyltransferase [Solirubrobacterales bacterium]
MSVTAPGTASPPSGDPVAWHDAENGGFGADLDLWLRLASERPGGFVDLGAGTGRVALPLADAGHPVIAVDTDPVLLGALAERSAGRAVETVLCDVRALDLGRTCPLIAAPMQLLHILGGPEGRIRAMAAVAAHLSPGGRFSAVVLEEPLPQGVGTPEPVPDVREVDGWVHSSLPTEVRIDDDGITMTRLRQLVAPDGRLTEAGHEVRLDRFTLAELDAEADAAGLWVVGAERLPSTLEYEDSVVVHMEVRRV